MYISIIDQEAGRFYQGKTSVSLIHSDKTAGQTRLSKHMVKNGLYKSEIELHRGGLFQLNLDFSEAGNDSPVLLEFQLDDNRSFAQTTLFIFVFGIFMTMFIIASVKLNSRKNHKKVDSGRRFICSNS